MRSHTLSTHTWQIYQIKFCHRLSDTQNHPKGRKQINIQTKAKVMKSAGVSGHEPSKGDGKSRRKPTKPQSNIPAPSPIILQLLSGSYSSLFSGISASQRQEVPWPGGPNSFSLPQISSASTSCVHVCLCSTLSDIFWSLLSETGLCVRK